MARILVAESDRAIREFIAGILADCGHDVLACENGIEASVWLATSAVDVLVSDILLDCNQELDLSRHCAALGIRTITLTGQEIQTDGREGDRPPTLLEKPFRFSDLRRVLRAVESVPSVRRTAAGSPTQLDPRP
jgi:two-component system cell cycle response regulator CpdR